MPLELCVVMPVYNEERDIGAVLEAWDLALSRLGADYLVHVYDDGSKDQSLAIIRRLAATHPRVIAHANRNCGHGPTILGAYRAHAAGARWIFQVDSEDGVGPDAFPSLWHVREDYDLLVGSREGARPLLRRIVSAGSRTVVAALYGRGVRDVNSPYRLMRSDRFQQAFEEIPADTFAPNVILSGYAVQRGLRIFEAPVKFRASKPGGTSLNRAKLVTAAARSFTQTARFAVRLRGRSAAR